MLKQLIRRLAGAEQRSWTLEEVRRLIGANRLTEAKRAAERLNTRSPDLEHVRKCLYAEIAFRERDDARAGQLFQEVLDQSPGFSDAHYGLSLLMLEAGKHHDAVRHALFAKGGQPNDPRYLAQLGLCHLHLKNYSAAEVSLRQAAQLTDSDKTLWNNLGIVVRARGEFGEALACFKKALALDPGFELAAENLARLHREVEDAGGVWEAAEASEPAQDDAFPWSPAWQHIKSEFRAGRTEQALSAAEDMAAQWADSAELACRVATLYQVSGDAQSAIDSLEAFLVAHDGDPVALTGLGRAYLKVHRYQEAERCLSKARSQGRDDPDFLSGLAFALHNQEKYSAAVDVLREIPPDLLSASYQKQLAASLLMACQYVEAVELYENLVRDGWSPLSATSAGWAMALANLQRFDEALALLGQAIESYPAEPNLRHQRSQILLLQHQFALGWEDYAYRGLSHSQNFRVLPFQKWVGEPLTGKTIVVLAEQGLGDQVMFASCLPDLLRLGPARVVVEAMHRVAPTLARSFPSCEVVATRQNRDLDWVRELGAVDYYVPLGDLPLHFRRSIQAFPRQAYLRAAPERVDHWRRQLAGVGDGPYVGVSWRGGTAITRTVLRTMDVTQLMPLRETGATLINLQYGSVKEDLRRAAECGLQIAHWPEAIEDLDEFAALICALDAVATVCNTTVHYAGALGKPVWVLAPQVPEWRYGLQGPVMPWYPHVNVLRQSAMGEWAPVVGQVSRMLSDHLWPEPAKNVIEADVLPRI